MNPLRTFFLYILMSTVEGSEMHSCRIITGILSGPDTLKAKTYVKIDIIKS